MSTTADRFLTELRVAVDEDRFGDASALASEFDASLFNVEQAAEALSLYRRKRLFQDLEFVATGCFFVGLNAPRLYRLYAQSLLDQGRLALALATLRRIEPQVENDDREGPEVRGLIGRGLKQLFVDEGDPIALGQAIQAYARDGRAAPAKHRWHGINLVACLMRADRDGIEVPRPVDPRELAAGILEIVSHTKEARVWDKATALEASIALGDRANAYRWLGEYALDRDADAFELGSTLRQLEEIWQLRNSDLGGSVLPILEGELLNRRGGAVPGRLRNLDSSGYQAVYGDESAQQMRWIDTLYKRCHSIARMQNEVDGSPAGTGFLAPGEWFNGRWGRAPVLVTNSHVVSVREKDEAPLNPQNAEAEFTRLEGRPRVKIGELLYSSPREHLDISVLRIVPPESAGPLGLTPYAPPHGDGPDAARVFVAGYGEGRELSVTLYDNQIREIDQHYARYRCPTVDGHSGSPVLNEAWDSFALHHKALIKRELNEGILLSKIRSEIQSGS